MIRLTECWGMGRSPFLEKEEASCPLNESEGLNTEEAERVHRRIERQFTADRKRAMRKPSWFRRLKRYFGGKKS